VGPEFFFRTSFKIAALKWGCPQAPRYSSESSCQVPNDHGFLKWQEAMGHGIFIDIAQICSNNIDSIMDSDLVSKNLCEGISNWYWLFLQNTFPNCWENWEKTPWNSYILGFLQWKYPTKKIQWFGVCTYNLGNLRIFKMFWKMLSSCAGFTTEPILVTAFLLNQRIPLAWTVAGDANGNWLNCISTNHDSLSVYIYISPVLEFCLNYNPRTQHCGSMQQSIMILCDPGEAQVVLVKSALFVWDIQVFSRSRFSAAF
jgi:hypothetical protein